MPRELTRQSARQEAGGSHLDIEVSSQDKVVRVALSGVMDDEGLKRVTARVAPHLLGLGYRLILDGAGLWHLDFRATGSLIRWNRTLRQFGHQLFLQNWNDYLKAIVCMEDWQQELGLPTDFSQARRGSRPGPEPMQYD